MVDIIPCDPCVAKGLLKEQSQLWDRADLGDGFLILKKDHLNLKSMYI